MSSSLVNFMALIGAAAINELSLYLIRWLTNTEVVNDIRWKKSTYSILSGVTWMLYGQAVLELFRQ